MVKGRIIKGVGGKYTVRTPEGDLLCHAKGILRHRNIKPLVGDYVLAELLGDEDGVANIHEILPRKNELIRPASANVDGAIIEIAVKNPAPSLNLLDRFLILMEEQGVKVDICVNKVDIDTDNVCDMIASIYRPIGYDVIPVSTYTLEGIDRIKQIVRGRTTVWAGPSGAGKSSLINCLEPENCMETGEISEKIKRGKNTTRHAQLLCCPDDTYVLDTPGFSSIDLPECEAADIGGYFHEFAEHTGQCRFGDCVHVDETDCGVKRHVGKEISRQRYDNYVLFYNELKNKKRY